ncbi:hypothetical protein [Bradyrhizobium ganzhouense]|uniref:hypothetical protein n=1 Tax=Bradyrhizobium ganzhouense TaxID=1179767 RepID=UPI003CE6C17E
MCIANQILRVKAGGIRINRPEPASLKGAAFVLADFGQTKPFNERIFDFSVVNAGFLLVAE